MEKILKARWIFPVDGPPIKDGVIEIEGRKIRNISSQKGKGFVTNLGNVAILPGLANAHTHLDLTGLRGKCPPSADFTGWLQKVIAYRRQQTDEQVEGDVSAGFEECLRSGTTVVGDISAQGWSGFLCPFKAVYAAIFFEVLGLTQERAKQSWRFVRSLLKEHGPLARRIPGLSPHAPYSVGKSLFDKTANLKPPLPIAIHLAESKEELQLLESQSGPFVEFLENLGVWDPQELIPNIDYLVQPYSGKKPLFIHGNYLHPDVVPADATIVYCPRTHHAFGHDPHPFREFLKRRINVAIGTDSLASNPDLSVLEEIRFLHKKYPGFPGQELLHMATLAGAKALGFDHKTGSLTPGKSAELVVVSLPDENSKDPYRLLLESSTPVEAVHFQSNWVWKSPSFAPPLNH